jgi:hypothetical protein
VVKLKEFGLLPDNVLHEIDRVYLTAAGVAAVEGPKPTGWSCSVAEKDHVQLMSAGTSFWFVGVHSVEVRRFGSETFAFAPRVPGAQSQISLGRDSVPRKWFVRFVTSAPFELCQEA